MIGLQILKNFLFSLSSSFVCQPIDISDEGESRINLFLVSQIPHCEYFQFIIVVIIVSKGSASKDSSGIID